MQLKELMEKCRNTICPKLYSERDKLLGKTNRSLDCFADSEVKYFETGSKGELFITLEEETVDVSRLLIEKLITSFEDGRMDDTQIITEQIKELL